MTTSITSQHPFWFSFFYKLSLSNKILLSTVVLLLIFGLAGTALFQRILRARLSDEMASNAVMLAHVGAPRAGELLARGDDGGLEALVKDIQRVDNSIGYVMVVDREGAVLAHTMPWDPPAELLVRGRGADGALEVTRVRYDGEDYLDAAAPIRSGTAGVGFLQLGLSTHRVDGFVASLNLIFLAILAGLTLLGALVARYYFNYVTRPIEEFTHLADQVSIGELDVDFAFGRAVRCWEIKNCRQAECAAYENTSVQCWYVDGTPCEGYEPSFPQKLAGCRNCEVYQAHKGDEIVQLADSFRHMTQNLQISRSELERSERFLSSLIRNSLGGVVATDEHDVVRIFNSVARHLTLYDEPEVVGQLTWQQLFAPELSQKMDKPLFRDGTKTIFGFYRLETTIIGKDGNPVDILASAITLTDGLEDIGKVFFFQDMREINRLRSELFTSARLAATGQTVASISHSIKNILEGLRGGAYIYKRGIRIENPTVRSEGWGMVEKNIEIISSLVADLLNYAKDRVPDRRPDDPGQLVIDVLETLRAKADLMGVNLSMKLDPAANPSSFDFHTMHQCLTNLVSNAVDATADVDQGRVTVSTKAVDDDVLEIRVSDNGPGVSQEVVDKLFTAMVSTKASKGTGLGLLVVHKVVTEHGGTVELLPQKGRGSTFRLRLPRGGEVELAQTSPESTSASVMESK